MKFSGKLEIQLHLGKGLKDVKHLGIVSPYAIIYVTLDGTKTKHVTNIAKRGDSDPVWDCSMVFNNVSTNENDNLAIEIKHDGKFFDREIGTVEVSFKDLLEGDASGDKRSYRVTTQPGSTQGEILLSHRFTNVVMRSDNEDDAVSSSSSTPTPSISTLMSPERKTIEKAKTITTNLDHDESGKKDDGKVKTITKEVVKVVCRFGVSVGVELVGNVVGEVVGGQVD